VVGLRAAIEYLDGLSRDRVHAHERHLLELAEAQLADSPGVRIVGTPRERTGVISFLVDGVHPHDVGTVLDHEGIAVRVGHHCAEPLMGMLGVPGTVRASFGCYNTDEEVARLVAAVRSAQNLLGGPKGKSK
jgi:cysteine desulfurase/selenocysteine lyase